MYNAIHAVHPDPVAINTLLLCIYNLIGMLAVCVDLFHIIPSSLALQCCHHFMFIHKPMETFSTRVATMIYSFRFYPCLYDYELWNHITYYNHYREWLVR